MDDRRGMILLTGMKPSCTAEEALRPLSRAQGMEMGEAGKNIFPAQAVSLAIQADPPLNPESQMSLIFIPGEYPGVMKLMAPDLSPDGEKGIFLFDAKNSVSMPLRALFHLEGDRKESDHGIKLITGS